MAMPQCRPGTGGAAGGSPVRGGGGVARRARRPGRGGGGGGSPFGVGRRPPAVAGQRPEDGPVLVDLDGPCEAVLYLLVPLLTQCRGEGRRPEELKAGGGGGGCGRRWHKVAVAAVVDDEGNAADI